MLAMVNAAPVQEDQKNLQGLLNILADQKTNKESTAQVANLVKLQQDDGRSQEAESRFIGKVIKHLLWANNQQDDDGRNQEAEAQLWRFVKGLAKQYAKKNSWFLGQYAAK